MLQATDIQKAFAGDNVPHPALRSVSLTIEHGEFVSVMGRSGSGKSTLLAVLSTLLAPDAGRLTYDGEEMTTLEESRLNRLRRSDFAMIFQFHHLMPYLTVEENVLLPFMHRIRPVSERQRRKARACLERVGLADKRLRLPGRLSGGEQQRVAIARALVGDSRILFADEPTGSLDRSSGENVLRLLQELNREGLTIVMVTHDEQYARMGSRIVKLADGRVVE